MPEAPEVQNVLNDLEAQLAGRKIVKAQFFHPKLADNMDPEEFARRLQGEHFNHFFRHGKFLIFELDHLDWIAHLRMEGKFLFTDPDQEDEKVAKHIHAIFDLDDGRKLCYYDTRKFGRMQLYDKPEQISDLEKIAGLGKDVLDPTLDGPYLYEKLHKRKIPVKTALLDQKIAAGIGNIYADEILFQAKIHPEKSCNTLSEEDCQNIAKAIHAIMDEAVGCGGTTIRTFSYGNHQPGTFQDHLAVHTRENEPCPVCGHPIECIKINNRSTYFCPVCQKKES